jgi:hypothetical protein
MRFKTMWFVTLLLAGLGLIMGGAHTLELIPKMRYSVGMYAEVNRTLYGLYGIAGGLLQVAAVLSAATLAWLTRGHPGSRLVPAGALCLVLSLALWFILVQPVNAAWGRVLQSGSEAAILESYASLRGRWEWGHVAAFAAWLCGTSLLLGSLVFEREAIN